MLVKERLTNPPGQWLQSQSNGSNVCQVLRGEADLLMLVEELVDALGRQPRHLNPHSLKRFVPESFKCVPQPRTIIDLLASLGG